MLDLYGLAKFSDGFPEYAQQAQCRDPYERVGNLEDAWRRDVDFPRFVPHLQLHEFEALVLVDVRVLKTRFIEHAEKVDLLAKAIADTGKTPELINDGEETSPSCRITSFLQQYERQKADAGSAAATAIGLPRLRAACPHFARWLSCLEGLGR